MGYHSSPPGPVGYNSSPPGAYGGSPNYGGAAMHYGSPARHVVGTVPAYSVTPLLQRSTAQRGCAACRRVRHCPVSRGPLDMSDVRVGSLTMVLPLGAWLRGWFRAVRGWFRAALSAYGLSRDRRGLAQMFRLGFALSVKLLRFVF